MRNTRTHIADIATSVGPLVRLTDRSCMSMTALGLNFQLEAGLIRKTKV
jgi:hypothetical protein